MKVIFLVCLIVSVGAFSKPLPSSFKAFVDGVSQDDVWVEAKRIVSTEYASSTKYPQMHKAISEYKRLHTWEEEIDGYKADAIVYRIKSVSGTDSFWYDGKETVDSLLDSLHRKLRQIGEEGCKKFRKMDASFVGNTMARTNLDKIVPVAQNLKDLFSSMIKRDDSHLHFPAYSRTCTMDSFSWVSYQAVLVDPTPYSGPENEAFLFLFQNPGSE